MSICFMIFIYGRKSNHFYNFLLWKHIILNSKVTWSENFSITILIHLKNFKDNESRGKEIKIFFFELCTFLNIKDSKTSSFLATHLFFLSETDGEYGWDIDGCFNPGSRFLSLNISCQLSTVAMLSPSARCFSVKREPTNDAGVACRQWHDPRSVVCGKVTAVRPVMEMINCCEVWVKVFIRMLNFWDQFLGQMKILRYIIIAFYLVPHCFL